jgi:uncharacterized protein
MEKDEIIASVARDMERKFSGESGGHDWWHIRRVWQLSRKIALHEKADCFIVELAALLHDVADWKYQNSDETNGVETIKSFLSRYPVSDSVISEVVEIVDSISYKGAGVPTSMKTLEGKIVQDADRLDAIGAIGIARTFAYGGMKGRVIYDPNSKP